MSGGIGSLSGAGGADRARPCPTQFVRHLLRDMQPRFRSVGSVFMVMGMPNVGKSSLVNAVRRNAMTTSSGKRRAPRLATVSRT